MTRRRHTGGSHLGDWGAIAGSVAQLASQIMADDPGMDEATAMQLARQKQRQLEEERRRREQMQQWLMVGGVGAGALLLVLVLTRN